MRTEITLAVVLGLAALAAPALAHDHAKSRPHDSTRNAISAEAMRQKITDLGYDVDHLKSEHGRFEARIVDRESGGVVEAVFSATSGELVRAKPKS